METNAIEPFTHADTLAFLIGLRDLTLRTGIDVGGCGCCGSAWAGVVTDVEWDERRNTYTFVYDRRSQGGTKYLIDGTQAVPIER